MVRQLVLKGATLVTMDERLGDLVADVLVSGDHIAAIGPGLAPDGAEIVDMTGRILIPGIINAHMHTWQTGAAGARRELDAARVLSSDACGLGD